MPKNLIKVIIDDSDIKESYFMTGSLEETNDAYSIAKIAGAKMCMEYSKQYKYRI